MADKSVLFQTRDDARDVLGGYAGLNRNLSRFQLKATDPIGCRARQKIGPDQARLGGPVPARTLLPDQFLPLMPGHIASSAPEAGQLVNEISAPSSLSGADGPFFRQLMIRELVQNIAAVGKASD